MHVILSLVFTVIIHIIRPSEVCYTQDTIHNKFNIKCPHRDKKIGETLDDICEGRCSQDDIPVISVAFVAGRWRTPNNRRLWVFKQLEIIRQCDEIPVRIIANISFAKQTSTNDRHSVRVKGSGPGGHWYFIVENTPLNKTTGKAVYKTYQCDDDEFTKQTDEIKAVYSKHQTYESDGDDSRNQTFESNGDELINQTQESHDNDFENQTYASDGYDDDSLSQLYESDGEYYINQICKRESYYSINRNYNKAGSFNPNQTYKRCCNYLINQTEHMDDDESIHQPYGLFGGEYIYQTYNSDGDDSTIPSYESDDDDSICNTFEGDVDDVMKHTFESDADDFIVQTNEIIECDGDFAFNVADKIYGDKGINLTDEKVQVLVDENENESDDDFLDQLLEYEIDNEWDHTFESGWEDYISELDICLEDWLDMQPFYSMYRSYDSDDYYY